MFLKVEHLVLRKTVPFSEPYSLAGNKRYQNHINTSKYKIKQSQKMNMKKPKKMVERKEESNKKAQRRIGKTCQIRFFQENDGFERSCRF